MKLDDISKCIDWMIKKDYLRIEYDYRLPLLVFSEKGWQIEKETFATHRISSPLAFLK